MKSRKKLHAVFTRQHGEFSCGLACLSMIVKYYGSYARQEDLRNISGTSLAGTSLLGLYQAAEKLHFAPEGYEADMKSLQSLDVPVILHIIKEQRLEHYVVCFGYENNRFIIGDPGESAISYWTENELNDCWKSKALLLLKPTTGFVRQDSEKKDKRQWLIKIIREDLPILVVAFVLGVVIAILGLATALFSQKLIDDLLPSKNYEKIIVGILLFFVLLLARNGLDFLRNIFMYRQTRSMNNRFVDYFFSKILYLPKFFFDSTKTGEIIARMNDSRRIQQTVSYVAGNVLIDALTLLFSISFLLFYSWRMALIASACIPFFVLLVILYNRRIINSQRNVMVSNAKVEGQLIDLIQGINDIKNANKQPVFKQSIQVMYGLFQQFGYQLGLLSSQYGLIAQTISITTSIMEEYESVQLFCKKYGFNTFFDAFPQGLNTLLGEDGVHISGGQQQLIALARALYRQPSLLLLDEPTSAMDSKTEQFVINLLQNRKDQYGILLVTHRIYLANLSDRVYRLENGSCLQIK